MRRQAVLSWSAEKAEFLNWTRETGIDLGLERNCGCKKQCHIQTYMREENWHELLRAKSWVRWINNFCQTSLLPVQILHSSWWVLCCCWAHVQNSKTLHFVSHKFHSLRIPQVSFIFKCTHTETLYLSPKFPPPLMPHLLGRRMDHFKTLTSPSPFTLYWPISALWLSCYTLRS